ncbi:MAG TPA: RNA polymerase factor sigma-54 [Steroidobacteraceae bacterium]|jgi:RNA polymerase sigma-54 factor|nr:RNA polymerase factor sigma-54 [Steroidobacteraceae bacterium]
MLKPSLQLKLGQQLTMTPQLQQAIRLLQLPTIELQAHIRELLESNVMLEQDEDTESATYEALSSAETAPETAAPAEEPPVEVVDDGWSDQSVGPAENPWSGGGSGDEDRQQEFADATGQTLREHLLWQLELARLNPRDVAIGRAVVDAINDDGYLSEPLDVIGASLKPELDPSVAEVERVLAIVQMFDPPGIGARSVSECLLLQLEQLEPTTPGLASAMAIARHHLELLAERELTALRRELRTSDEELETAVALVRACHPRPGSIVSGSSPEYVVPDVFVRRTPRGWSVEINAATLPRVRLNQSYASLVGRSTSHASMRAQLQEARWLLKSLEIRNDTLTKVARSIVERQSEFLDQGEEYMRPMILRDIAEAIAMHESTVSRVTSGKYMHTPRGVFELRYFFSSQVEGSDGSGTSSTAIRAKIRKLIREEDPAAPLSDSRIAEILSGEGIPVARRTVAKYRETMGLSPSNERRRVNGK